LKASKIGYVLSTLGTYPPDQIEITLLKDSSVHRGEYLYIDHDGKHIFIQAENVYVKRPTSSYDEKLVKDDVVIHDSEKIVGKALCTQVGYDVGDSIQPYLHPIPPLAPVYKPTEEELYRFITPRGPSITIGKIYPTDAPLTLDLKILFRQGALVVGGVGTGKSTLLLTLMMRILENVRLKPHILLIDWDGEYNTSKLIEYAEMSGGYVKITSKTHLKKREKNLSPTEWYHMFKRITGLHPQSSYMRALYGAVKTLEEKSVTSVEWSIEGFKQISEHITSPEAKKFLELQASTIFEKTAVDAGEEGIDIIEAVGHNAIVHVDFTDADNWDEIIYKTRDILEACYLEARANQSFGVAVFIDEVHNFCPQSPHEGAASKEAYNAFIPLMKLIATTGPRNGVPLFIATQRLSEVDKFISTQMGQNTFAFRVEDIDLERLRGIVGSDIAYSVRLLPRGYCIYKGHALRVQRPVITIVEKVADVASVGRDLLTRWAEQ
jgi:DNA helicase HerA-like ATPase